MGITLSISNIAWDSSKDDQIYRYLRERGYSGLEIAPTRIFLEKPYSKLQEAEVFSKHLLSKYGLKICSLQSIWYGRSEKLFSSDYERTTLLDYTKEAINFAESVSVRNLVFGCPKNRCINRLEDRDTAVGFFRELGDCAIEHGTVLAVEANPVIYGTNFINTTREAIELIKDVASDGFKLNLDFGTIIYNEEEIMDLVPSINLVNHVHISEPNLKRIQNRAEHEVLINILRENSYSGFISIEMGKQENISDIFETIDYVAELCGAD